MRPRLEWLETFLAVAESRSFTLAGERLARSQSTVSLQLRRLEEVVGARLLERDTRRVHLTPAGERFLPRAHRALDAADGAVAAVRGGERRTVRVGVPEEYADDLVPALLDGVSQHDAEVAFEVQCAASGQLQRRLRAKQLDLAFALADEVDARGATVLTDPVVWLQAPRSGLVARRPLPVALFDQACSWRGNAIEALESAGIDYRVVFTSTSVAGVRAALRAGFAVGALSVSTAGDMLERLVGEGAPPSLPTAELTLLRGDARDADVASLVARVRRRLGG